MSIQIAKSTLTRRAFRQLSRRAFSASPRALADHVRIIEVGPRDGLQNEKTSIPVQTKVELVNRLASTGLTTIEAGSFVAPKWVPQVCPLPIRVVRHWTRLCTDALLVDGSIRRGPLIHSHASTTFVCADNIPMAASECQGSGQLLQSDEHLEICARWI